MPDFWNDPISKMSLDELTSAASGSGIGVLPQDQSTKARAAERLQREERKYSVRSEDSGKYMLGGEAVRLGIELGVKSPKIKVPLQKYGLALDALSNTFGANSSTNAGDDPYNRHRVVNGRLEKVAPTGTDASSQITNLIEGGIGALQMTKVGAIPASLAAGELTEMQIHQAERDNSKVLAQIAARTGPYASVENAVRDIDMLNAAQSEPGKLSGDFWASMRADKKAKVEGHLNRVRQAIASKDEARIDQAAQVIPLLAEYMDEFNADMEAVQTSSQELTWPVSRLGEFVADEAPNTTFKHFLNPDRFIETMFTGNVQSHGFMDYLNPSGKNMKQYVQRRQFTGEDKRTRVQGDDLAKELHSRALEATGGVDPRKARDAKQKAIADNFSVADPGYGLYQ